jgi:hypothetical protein
LPEQEQNLATRFGIDALGPHLQLLKSKPLLRKPIKRTFEKQMPEVPIS